MRCVLGGAAAAAARRRRRSARRRALDGCRRPRLVVAQGRRVELLAALRNLLRLLGAVARDLHKVAEHLLERAALGLGQQADEQHLWHDARCKSLSVVRAGHGLHALGEPCAPCV